ncbi:MAG: sel1 repeat family protein [Pseudomonadota bacterium]|nr:sel1 repeat family protein [Pseudomonadota bacterium]
MPYLNKSIFYFIIVLMYGLGMQAAWADMDRQQARELEDQAYDGDPSALQTLQQAAYQKNATAEEWLGVYFMDKKDYPDSFTWNQKSANQGNAYGEANLGYMYHNGLGVSKDDVQAVSWYQKAAEQDNALAEYDLGWMYEKGYGVSQDYARAMSLYQKAATNRYYLAPANIGNL